jgi:hypothetical protein
VIGEVQGPQPITYPRLLAIMLNMLELGSGGRDSRGTSDRHKRELNFLVV